MKKMLVRLYPLKTIFMVSMVTALISMVTALIYSTQINLNLVLTFQNYLNYILTKVVDANDVSNSLASKVDNNSLACVVPKLDP